MFMLKHLSLPYQDPRQYQSGSNMDWNTSSQCNRNEKTDRGNEENNIVAGNGWQVLYSIGSEI